jgi:hypothetical protein
MTQLITIILTSLAVTGTYFTIKEFLWTFRTNEGSFNFIYDSSPWYYKPIFTCITCMSSLWGSAYYWIISLGLFLGNSSILIISDAEFVSMVILWPITCVSCAFLNTWFYKLIEN